MSREDIIRMAREAGFEQNSLGMTYTSGSLPKLLERFAAVVASAEREACAKVCDFEVARLTAIDEPRPALTVGICAAAIRARGNT